MNLILFSREEVREPLPRSDPRARHLLHHLKRGRGERFDAGLIDGPRGKGWIEEFHSDRLQLNFVWENATPAFSPLVLVVGLPRPQTARRILREAAAFGIEAILFFAADKGVASYRSSKLWAGNEYRQRLIEGAEQAFSTRLPRVTLHDTLAEALVSLPTGRDRIALDVYEAEASLSTLKTLQAEATLAVGPERGWAAGERDALRRAGFRLAHLGDRVLRSDTACICGMSLVLAARGKL